jgi:hypothetical protein
MRITLNAIINSLPQLGDVLFVFVFCLAIISMIAMQFYSNRFRFHCVNPDGTAVCHCLCVSVWSPDHAVPTKWTVD